MKRNSRFTKIVAWVLIIMLVLTLLPAAILPLLQSM